VQEQKGEVSNFAFEENKSKDTEIKVENVAK